MILVQPNFIPKGSGNVMLSGFQTRVQWRGWEGPDPTPFRVRPETSDVALLTMVLGKKKKK